MEKSLNESIIEIRVKLQNAKLKKSGKNKFAGFDYFELSDFLPKLNELMQEEGMNDRFSIINNNDGTMTASLLLIKGEENQVYTMPFVMFDTPTNRREDRDTGEIYEVKSMQDIQYLGALNTYYKRYLYLNAFGITDGEIIDSMNNEENVGNKKERKITEGQLKVLNKLSDDAKYKVCTKYEVNKLEDLTMKQASELIASIKAKKESEGESK